MCKCSVALSASVAAGPHRHLFTRSGVSSFCASQLSTRLPVASLAHFAEHVTDAASASKGKHESKQTNKRLLTFFAYSAIPDCRRHRCLALRWRRRWRLPKAPLLEANSGSSRRRSLLNIQIRCQRLHLDVRLSWLVALILERAGPCCSPAEGTCGGCRSPQISAGHQFWGVCCCFSSTTTWQPKVAGYLRRRYLWQSEHVFVVGPKYLPSSCRLCSALCAYH